MIDEQIRDGDFVIVEDRKTADNGEMVDRAGRRHRRHAEEVLPRERPHPAAAGQPRDAADLRRPRPGADPGRGRRGDAEVLSASTRRTASRLGAADQLCRCPTASRSTSPSCPTNGPARAAHLRELLLDRAHAVRLHADLLRGACRSRRRRSARPKQEHVVRAPVRARDRRAGAVRARPDRRAAGAHARLLRVVLATSAGPRQGSDSLTMPRRREARDAGRDPRRARARSIPNADTELHYRNAVRAAGRHDPVGAVDRRAREPGHAGAVRALSRRRGAGRGRRRRRSSRRSHATGFFRQKSKALIGMAQALVERARRRGAGRHGRARRSCPASAARPRTSCSATRSASPGCRSIATCCASRTASASPTATIR